MIIKNLISTFSNIEYKKINNIAIPLMLNNFSSMIISICDEAMIGRVSLVGFASVGIISTTVNSITGVLGSISVGFNIIGSRCKGENDYDKLRSNFMLNIFISTIVGFIFFLGTLKFGYSLIEYLYGLKGETLVQAVEYFNIFSLSIGLNMILFTFSSYFKIMNRTKYILYGNMIASVSNVLFDYILIFGKLGFSRLGIKGNAIGTILALVLNVVVYVIAIRKDEVIKILNLNLIENLKNTVRLSMPIMGEEILESTLLIIGINSILSRIGVLEVSAYNLLLSIVGIASMPIYAYSQASLTIIAENLNAKNIRLIKVTARRCLLLSMIFYLSLSIIFLMLKNYIPYLITDDQQLIKSSIEYMTLAFIINILYIPLTVYKYSLQGYGDVNWVFISSIIINFIGMIFIFSFAKVLNLRLYGVYIGMLLNYMLLSVAFYRRYKNLKL